MKKLEGIVVSDKMQKTAIVEVTRKVVHPLYKKVLKRSNRYKVDPGKFSIAVGDRVVISEIKKLSKDKYFTVSNILSTKEKK